MIRHIGGVWAVLAALAAMPIAAGAEPEPQSPPLDDVLTAARGAVLMEASHNSRAALALIDGDDESSWSIATKRNPAPYVFTVELMAPAQLSAVGVVGAGERPGGVVGGSAKKVRVDAASTPRDGAFTTLATIEAAPSGLTLVEVPGDGPAIHALRFTVDGAQSPEAAFLYLNEIVALGEMEAPGDADRFTGAFATARADVVALTQDGASVTGCYSENSGLSAGAISGSVVDGVALTEWRSDKGIVGTALFTIDSTGALSGVRYRQRSRSSWGGPRLAEDAAVPCAGETDADNPILDALDHEGEAKIYGILFNHDADAPRSVSLPALEQLLAALEARPDMAVVIEGHTDGDGSQAYNQGLSARRAAAIVSWLTDRGVSSERLTSDGKGETEPVASNATADGKALNRRVEVAVRP